MTESFAELFEQSQTNLAKLKPGSIVIGTVVEVRGDVVVINARLKSEGIVRTDFAFNWRRRLPGTVRGDVFAALQILNIMNRTTILHPERLLRVNTAFNDPSLQRFNPFSEPPAHGVHWTFDESDTRTATARASIAKTLPRTYRFILGIRF